MDWEGKPECQREEQLLVFSFDFPTTLRDIYFYFLFTDVETLWLRKVMSCSLDQVTCKSDPKA